MAISISGSKRFTVNFQPTLNTDHATWAIELFATLVAAGWIPVDFSDGSSVITSATPATEVQIDASNAWQRFRAPSGAFELWVQRGTNGSSWRGAYDPDGFNNDGGIATTPTPTSYLIRIFGNATNYDSSWSGNTNQANTRRYHICVDSVAGQTGFYYFHILQNTVGTGTVTKRAVFSPLESGTFAPEDLSPYASLGHTSSGAVNENSTWASVFKKGLAGEILQETLNASYWSTFANGGVVSPYNSKHLFIRLQLEDNTGGDAHMKGATLDCFLPASPTGALGLTDTLNLSTPWSGVAEGDPGALFRYDSLLVPWPHGVTPLI